MKLKIASESGLLPGAGPEPDCTESFKRLAVIKFITVMFLVLGVLLGELPAVYEAVQTTTV